MQLLTCSAVPSPEFVALSLVMKPDLLRESPSVKMGEPILLVSPLSTVSNSEAVDALKELHWHLNSIMKASLTTSTVSKEDRVIMEILREEEKFISDIQIFRPSSCYGIGLYFKVIQGDDSSLATLSSVVLAHAQNGSATAKLDSSSGLRMADCEGLIIRMGGSDLASLKGTLSTFLLTEDEHRKTNAMVDSANLLYLPEIDEQAKGLMSPMGLIAPIAGVRKKRISMKSGAAGSNPGETGIQLLLTEGSAEATRTMVERVNVLSVSETDTFLRKYELTGQERKMNLDLTGGSKSRFRRRKSDAKDADFDGFDYKGPAREAVVRAAVPALSQTADANHAALLTQLRTNRKDTRSKGPSTIPSLPAARGSVSNRRSSNQSESVAARRLSESAGRHLGHESSDFDPFSEALDKGFQSGQSGRFDEEASDFYANSVSRVARVQVNIALNEDLSCSYRNSQLAACGVEGVVQVQVKSNTAQAGPFYLVLRDPSTHIGSLQENKKFAEERSQMHNTDEEGADRRFLISIPRAENYFPVLKYKCSSELRPVPMRVQTRVKADGGVCRVALQISSNPNNAASLTDLTIILSVPDAIHGETLVTQPAGGVWDESKRSVIWCVSELGHGEKFQLQARFDMDHIPAEDLPGFPVLVRCQCLFAQLSDIELEVHDAPDIAPAEITMKVARRFRLSHKEKS